MKSWTRQYLIIKNPDDGLCWQLKYGTRFEIVGQIDDYYFLWTGGTMTDFPKHGKYAYTIEEETVNTE